MDRALKSRGKGYPVIGLFAGQIDDSLVSPGIRTRLYVSLTDPDWKERIAAAAEGRQPRVAHQQVTPFVMKIHEAGKQKVIEIRPRAGVWAPCFAAVPIAEKGTVNLSGVLHGPRDQVPVAGAVSVQEGQSSDGQWWVLSCGEGANPLQSCYFFCDQLPSEVLFGALNKPPQFRHTFRQG